MTAWSDGYVSDIAYSLGYYREMAPNILAFAALSLGKNPGLSAKPRRVLELGFGMGLGFVLGAAANPDAVYEGCDFNPEHVAHARRLADDASITNVTIREASFQELAAEADEGQHDVDIIQLHGILTWVNSEAQRAIVEIARKRLKPGGLLYVSYNCMPGWAPMVPIQRLMREHTKRNGSNSPGRTAAAIAAVKALAAANGRFFLANPAIGQRLETMTTQQASYLAHEYFNESWFIFHVADVAQMMSGAKLTYLGSATIAENINSVAVPPEMHQIVDEASDPIWRETLRDFASNKQFRRDIYARGLSEMNNSETHAVLKTTHYTLALPRKDVTLKLPGPLGELDAKPELYTPIADLLADRIVRLDEIASLPALSSVGLSGTLQSLALMIHAGQVLPIIAEPNTDVVAGQRFNRMIAARAEQGRFHNFIAAPVARTGLPASNTDLLSLSGVFAGQGQDATTLMKHVATLMHRLGIGVQRDGKAITDAAEAREILAKAAESFIADKLPLWKRLGAV